MQNSWIIDEGLDAIYCAFEPENFELCLNGLIEAKINGLNITAPFKEKAAKACGFSSKDVEIMGAANTIIIDNNCAKAFNTDGEGLILDLDNRAKNWRVNNEIVTIFGAGGAAKGIICALINANVKQINIIARDNIKANELIDCAKKLDNSDDVIFKYYAWNDKEIACKDAGLIINATSIGLYGNGNLELDFSKITNKSIIYDMVYYPNETYFIKSAINNGNQTLNGIGMLVGQGALAFQKWFGIMPNYEKGLKRIIENA